MQASGSGSGLGVGQTSDQCLEVPVTYGVTDLSMPQIDSLFQQWQQGAITIDEVQRVYGPDVREFLELQLVAMNGGMNTQG